MKNNIVIGLIVILILGVGYIAYNSNYINKIGGNYTMMGNKNIQSSMMGDISKDDEIIMGNNNQGDMMGTIGNNNQGDMMGTIGNNNNISNEELIYGNGQEAIPEKKQEIVNLKNGDNYTIEITKIKKDIGGREVEMLAYNGSVPGPIIKTKVGTKANVTIVNKVKDLETSLHSHGLRLSDMFDGVVKSMKGKNDPIEYGDSFTYELNFPDVGVYWYHPHLREDIQQELGLYGNYIVEPNDDNYYSKVNREGPIILDDIDLNGNKVTPFYKDFTNYVLMGRFGNTSFINGSSNYTFNMKSGEVVRAYLTNVANTRTFNFKIPGVKMKLVGSDIGKYENETFIDSIIISPGERYIVDLYAPNSGTFEIQNATPDENYIIGKVVVSDEKVKTSYKNDFEILRENKDIVSDIDKYRPYFDKKIGKNLSFQLGTPGEKGGLSENSLGMMMGGGMMGNDDDEIEWYDKMPMMNKRSNSKMLEWKMIDEDTKAENMNIDWQFKKGDIVKIHLENKEDGAHPMQHPFHMHGQRFLVIERNGEKQTNLVWKDTVLVKTGESVDILVDMSNPGEWMAHCHISEHLFSGMMMHFSVKE